MLSSRNDAGAGGFRLARRCLAAAVQRSAEWSKDLLNGRNIAEGLEASILVVWKIWIFGDPRIEISEYFFGWDFCMLISHSLTWIVYWCLSLAVGLGNISKNDLDLLFQSASNCECIFLPQHK